MKFSSIIATSFFFASYAVARRLDEPEDATKKPEQDSLQTNILEEEELGGDSVIMAGQWEELESGGESVNTTWSSPSTDCSERCLYPGVELYADDYICANDDDHHFGLSSGGLLAKWDDNHRVWSSGKYGNRLHQQSDGNLVLYDENSDPWWESGCLNDNGARVCMEDDEVVARDRDGNRIWGISRHNHFWYNINHCRQTEQNPCVGNFLNAGNRLYHNQYICGRGSGLLGYNRFGLDDDGELEDRSGSDVNWSPGKDGDYLHLQHDGNLVLYKNGEAKWAAGCVGYPYTYLFKSQSRGVKLYDTNGNVIWEIDSNGRERKYCGGSGTIKCKGRYLKPGERLERNEYICGDGDNEDHRFGLDDTGLLAEWDGGSKHWSSGERGDYLHMQRDRNLVLYKNGNPATDQWATNTVGSDEAYLKKRGSLGVKMIEEDSGDLVWQIKSDGTAEKCPCR